MEKIYRKTKESKFVTEITDKEIHHNKMNFTIKAVPFSWNDNLSEDALDFFDEIKPSLSYGTCVVICTALAKLQILEKQGAKVNENALSSR